MTFTTKRCEAPIFKPSARAARSHASRIAPKTIGRRP